MKLAICNEVALQRNRTKTNRNQPKNKTILCSTTTQFDRSTRCQIGRVGNHGYGKKQIRFSFVVDLFTFLHFSFLNALFVIVVIVCYCRRRCRRRCRSIDRWQARRRSTSCRSFRSSARCLHSVRRRCSLFVRNALVSHV